MTFVGDFHRLFRPYFGFGLLFLMFPQRRLGVPLNGALRSLVLMREKGRPIRFHGTFIRLLAFFLWYFHPTLIYFHRPLFCNPSHLFVVRYRVHGAISINGGNVRWVPYFCVINAALTSSISYVVVA